MADISGNYTRAQWMALPDEDHVLTGDTSVTLVNGEGGITYGHNLSGAFNFNLIGDGERFIMTTGTNTHGSTTVTSGVLQMPNGNLLGQGTVTLAGGTLEFNGSVDAMASNPFEVSADSTLTLNINSGERGGSLTLTGIISGTGNLTLNGGDNINYLPSLISDAANTNTGAITVAEGVSFELVNLGTTTATWAGDVTLMGDLKGNGTVSGSVTSTGGRLSPGTTVGSSMTITQNLVMDTNSNIYFGMDSESVIDYLTVGGTATLDGTATMVPYIDGSGFPAGSATYNLIRVTGTITDNTLAMETFAGYADGDETTTTGTFSRTMTGAVDGQNYVLTISA